MMGGMPDDLLDDALRDRLHDLYRHLHAHPELSMQEHETAALLRDRLRDLGWSVREVGGTGLVAVLENGAGPVVGFRADTDGLPVQEDTGLEYASTVRRSLPDGTVVPAMHACGHDMHMTWALGLAELLLTRRGEWRGTVVLLLQPGEETAAGAAAMVADGVWEGTPHPEVVLGQHVSPDSAGAIRLASGPAMAMADSWEVVVRGRGGHGSRPDATIDPILLGAHMVVRLQSVTAREVPAQAAAVVTVATFHGGLKENIIPSEARFTVNVRTLDPGVRESLLAALRRVITAEAEASGAPEPQIRELYTFPLLHNDEEQTERTVRVLRDTVGEDAVTVSTAQMGSEDFGHLPDAIGVPGVYWFVGGSDPERADADEPVPGNHSPHFAPVIEPTLTAGLTAAWTVVRDRLADA